MSTILFGLNIAQLVADSISSAGGLLDGVLVKRTSGTRTPGNLTGGTNPAEGRHNFQGFVENRSEVRSNGSLVSAGGEFVSILGATLPAGVEPSQGDQIEIESTTFTITEISERDPAAALYMCRVSSS